MTNLNKEIAAGYEVATLGGGCFWCIEPIYNDLRGVESSVSGYTGGHIENPTYKDICTGRTGHAEVIQITFDPQEISYKDILKIFFAVHDPTTLNRQGNDVGTQYRSAIFTHNDAQKAIADEVIAEVEKEGLYRNAIVTEVTPLDVFYPAEDYHQNYLENNPYQPYCQFVVAPKVSKFRKMYVDRLKK